MNLPSLSGDNHEAKTMALLHFLSVQKFSVALVNINISHIFSELKTRL